VAEKWLRLRPRRAAEYELQLGFLFGRRGNEVGFHPWRSREEEGRCGVQWSETVGSLVIYLHPCSAP
jgi:hypothetical protein